MAGLGFARDQLVKQGWKEGKGLGKEEDGITKAIKVGIKQDTQGVGYKISDQFTFHWWDHIFNKTAKSIVVKENEDGVQVTKDDSCSQPISNKRPNKHSLKPLLYGCFVKASETSPEMAESDSENEEFEKDFSTGHAEDIVFKACGGRTAHKGARHGLSLNGKLKRIEEHDKIAMSEPCSRSTSPIMTTDIEEKTTRKLKKKQRLREEIKSYSDSEGCVSKKKKKKKKKKERHLFKELEEYSEKSPIRINKTKRNDDLVVEKETSMSSMNSERKMLKKKSRKERSEILQEDTKCDDSSGSCSESGKGEEKKTRRKSKNKVRNEEEDEQVLETKKAKRKKRKIQNSDKIKPATAESIEPLTKRKKITTQNSDNIKPATAEINEPPTKKKKRKKIGNGKME